MFLLVYRPIETDMVTVLASYLSVKKNGRLCRATAASFYVNTSLRAERNKLNQFMNTFIY